MSPGFSSGGPLSPQYATGVSIRDKCIEMLAAALRTDSEAKITVVITESRQAADNILTDTQTAGAHAYITIVCRLT